MSEKTLESMKNKLAPLARRIYAYASRDLLLLVGVLVVIGGMYAFLQVLDEVIEGETETFDRYVIGLMGELPHHRAFEQVGTDLSALGGISVLTLVVLMVAGYLLICKKYGALGLLLVSVLGGCVLTFALKGFIARDRPHGDLHKTYVLTKSFPSAHAMLSTVVYLTIGALMARLTSDYRLKFYYVAVAILLSGMIGLTRVYLRVHWPTDVLAGWSAGLVWAITCWAVARSLQRHGRI